MRIYKEWKSAGSRAPAPRTHSSHWIRLLIVQNDAYMFRAFIFHLILFMSCCISSVLKTVYSLCVWVYIISYIHTHSAVLLHFRSYYIFIITYYYFGLDLCVYRSYFLVCFFCCSYVHLRLMPFHYLWEFVCFILILRCSCTSSCSITLFLVRTGDLMHIHKKKEDVNVEFERWKKRNITHTLNNVFSWCCSSPH